MKKIGTIPLELILVAALMLVAACSGGDDSSVRAGDAASTSQTIGPESATSSAPVTSASDEAPLDPATTATGHVVGPDGAPVANANVDPVPLDGQEMAAADSLSLTDAHGRYQSVLAPGRWELHVSADGFDPTVAQITVPDQGTVVTDVTLTPSA